MLIIFQLISMRFLGSEIQGEKKGGKRPQSSIKALIVVLAETEVTQQLL